MRDMTVYLISGQSDGKVVNVTYGLSYVDIAVHNEPSYVADEDPWEAVDAVCQVERYQIRPVAAGLAVGIKQGETYEEAIGKILEFYKSRSKR